MKNNLLLHVCCGPCSTHTIKELIKDYNVTLFFSNSNIYPKEEYEKRIQNARIVAKEFNLNLIEDIYDHQSWLDFIKGLEKEPEGKLRCEKCYEFRLRKTAEYAKDNDFNLFTTTLTVSPFKNAKAVSIIGNNLSKKINISFLDIDFKENNGFQNSIKLSKNLDLYRQNYCGCEFSIWEK